MTDNSSNTSILFSPIRIGSLELPNRIIMAPLTRCRADDERVPTSLMAEYYTQRSTAGLILTEATSVEPMGVGYPNTPGIWSDAQVKGWQKITRAVHAKGGRIFLQLWHVGRISDPHYLNGKLPVAPSAIKPAGHPSLLRPKRDFVTPRALETDEIPKIVAAYKKGAENAKLAGFDGVEVHGANGYLLDQFLQDSTNQRKDQYGGSIENRARLMLEVVDAAIDVWGADRVGLHIAPDCDSHDMGDSDPLATFSYVAEAMRKRKLAFIFARAAQTEAKTGAKLKSVFKGPFIANQQLTKEIAETIIENGEADACAWGQKFIANPDLVRRFKEGLDLNEPDSDTFYAQGAKGYTDYAFAE